MRCGARLHPGWVPCKVDALLAATICPEGKGDPGPLRQLHRQQGQPPRRVGVLGPPQLEAGVDQPGCHSGAVVPPAAGGGRGPAGLPTAERMCPTSSSSQD